MNGMRLTPIKLNGRMLINTTAALLVFSLLLTGCSLEWWFGNGRGDWTLDLCSGYAISKINSYEILLVHKDNPGDSGGTIVIQNYFVTGYQIYAPYLCVAGICTQAATVSEEELEAMTLCYYLVDTTNEKVTGPFENYDDFVAYCNSMALEIEKEWICPQG